MDNNYGMNAPVAPMSFGEAITKCFNNYANFNGRASRAEFWWWFLFCFIVGAGFGILQVILGDWIGYIGGLANLALLIPTLAVSWRRLHDISKAGGWWFINFIPVVGSIIFIVWCIQAGQPGANRFGEAPVK